MNNGNKGYLIRNKNKTAGDRRPDYVGGAEIGGVGFFASGWIRKTDSGETYMSLSYELKEKQENAPEALRRAEAEKMRVSAAVAAPAQPAATTAPAAQPPQGNSDDVPF